MNYFKRYMMYVRDNPNGYWFKRKLYGWGWTPVKWQGWLVILALVALLVLNAFALASNNPAPTDSDVMWFVIKIVLLVLATILICYKTGEKPKWQWGG